VKSRSGDLLRRAMLGSDIAADDIRRDLGLNEADFDQLIAGTTVMSLPHQLRFATLLIERVPPLERAGRTLKNQVLAAMAYAEGATTTHGSQPVKWSSLKTLRV
jgi:hypothetical protein